jgi:predicted lipid-binding transport protein (Tim44 family)
LTLVGLAGLPVLAQEAIYRCGNTYTNDVRQAQQAGCQRIEATPVTVPGTQVQRRSASVEQPAPTPQAPQAPQARAHTRIDSAQQRARDADARFILETELRKAQERLAQLQAEFKQGEPDKQGIEGRHHQRYLDRVQALREELARQQADVASLQRELARLPATVASTP